MLDSIHDIECIEQMANLKHTEHSFQISNLLLLQKENLQQVFAISSNQASDLASKSHKSQSY